MNFHVTRSWDVTEAAGEVVREIGSIGGHPLSITTLRFPHFAYFDLEHDGRAPLQPTDDDWNAVVSAEMGRTFRASHIPQQDTEHGRSFDSYIGGSPSGTLGVVPSAFPWRGGLFLVHGYVLTCRTEDQITGGHLIFGPHNRTWRWGLREVQVGGLFDVRGAEDLSFGWSSPILRNSGGDTPLEELLAQIEDLDSESPLAPSSRIAATVIGCTEDGELRIVVIDEEKERSAGATIPEILAISQERGLHTALLGGTGADAVVALRTSDRIEVVNYAPDVRPVGVCLKVFPDSHRH